MTPTSCTLAAPEQMLATTSATICASMKLLQERSECLVWRPVTPTTHTGGQGAPSSSAVSVSGDQAGASVCS